MFSTCHCSERRRRDAASKTTWWSALFGKKGWLSFLTQTQLCPVIWAIVLGLMAMFFFKVGPSVKPIKHVMLHPLYLAEVLSSCAQASATRQPMREAASAYFSCP